MDDDAEDKLCDHCGKAVSVYAECEPDDLGFCIECGLKIGEAPDA
jgi:hypothetical protein